MPFIGVTKNSQIWSDGTRQSESNQNRNQIGALTARPSAPETKLFGIGDVRRGREAIDENR